MESAEPADVRLFYALWPDDAVRDALMALQAPLQGRLTQRANLHLTLAFLGAQPAAKLPLLQTLLQDLPSAGFTLTIDRTGHFGQRRIAWAGMQRIPPQLLALHAELNRLLDLHLIAFDRRPDFRPHLTLARNAPAPPDAAFALIHWRAGE